jgi:hypothetical protein
MPAAELNKLKVEELQKLLKDKGLATTGKKAELVQVLPRSDPPLLPLDDVLSSLLCVFLCSHAPAYILLCPQNLPSGFSIFSYKPTFRNVRVLTSRTCVHFDRGCWMLKAMLRPLLLHPLLHQRQRPQQRLRPYRSQLPPLRLHPLLLMDRQQVRSQLLQTPRRPLQRPSRPPTSNLMPIQLLQPPVSSVKQRRSGDAPKSLGWRSKIQTS